MRHPADLRPNDTLHLLVIGPLPGPFRSGGARAALARRSGASFEGPPEGARSRLGSRHADRNAESRASAGLSSGVASQSSRASAGSARYPRNLLQRRQSKSERLPPTTDSMQGKNAT